MRKLCIIFLGLLLLTGCGGNAKSLQNRAAEGGKSGTVIINNGREKTYTGVNGTVQNEVEQFEAKHSIAEDRAAGIADEINKLPQVKNAAVVVSGNTAIVGLTLNETLNDGKLIELKKTVERAVKKTDAEIDHVAVSSAPDLYEKILGASGNTDREREELQNSDGVKQNEDILFKLVPTV